MLKHIRNIFSVDENENNRKAWIEKTILSLPSRARLLDAGAGELRNKPLCSHLEYVSQDFCQYEGLGNGAGLHTGGWDTSKIDIVCDVCNIPEPDASFDVILCSEVLEHVPDPIPALDEFTRLLKPGGKLILTAPFASLVHFAPYYYSSGFSKYWYEYHLSKRGFDIVELTPNGDWFAYLNQETLRLPAISRQYDVVFWPIAYVVGIIMSSFLMLCNRNKKLGDVGCFGWHCIAVKNCSV